MAARVMVRPVRLLIPWDALPDLFDRERQMAKAAVVPIEGRLVGESAAIRETLQRIRQFALMPGPVLFEGETGTGKELGARMLFQLSGRRSLVTVNCAALVESLVDSELFGYVRHAFTGAFKDTIGIIGQANGGTLFLDEFAELSLSVQAKLLRTFENGEFRRVGSTRTERSDFWLIAATNRNVEAMAACGKIRQDIRHRLGVARIVMPPLRARPEDISLLASYLLERFRQQCAAGPVPTRFTAAALNWLSAQRWPGNVRQLRHVIETAAAIAAPKDVLDAHHFSTLLSDTERPDTAPEDSIMPLDVDMRRYEASRILRALALAGGNRKEAARLLKIGEATLYRRLLALKAELAELGGIPTQRPARP